MNPTSLYVSICKLVMQVEENDPSVWTDLCTLIPYLRQSLSCAVCGELLIEPCTPSATSCQHHVCKLCKGGKKRIKPACVWCKNDDNYTDNVHLRLLLQCYKKMCEYIMSCSLTLTHLSRTASQIDSSSNVKKSNASSSLLDIIREGSGFKDNFKSTVGLSKSAYSILPCVYTNSSTQTLQSNQSTNDSSILRTAIRNSGQWKTNTIKTLNSSTPILSSLNTPRVSRPVIKKKSLKKIIPPPDYSVHSQHLSPVVSLSQTSTPKTKAAGSKPMRNGCRCGNATASPGKLTCCGQRCPCYIESKACSDCKCRGCRNPHISDGQKKLPDLNSYPVHIADLHLNMNDQSSVIPSNATVQVVGVYTTQLETLPGRFVIGNDGCLTDGDSINTTEL